MSILDDLTADLTELGLKTFAVKIEVWPWLGAMDALADFFLEEGFVGLAMQTLMPKGHKLIVNAHILLEGDDEAPGVHAELKQGLKQFFGPTPFSLKTTWFKLEDGTSYLD